MDDKIIETIDLYQSITRLIEEERKKLPYNFNLLEAVHETGHSRILCNLLNQVYQGHHEVLANFYSYCHKLNPNFDFKIVNPSINTEVDHIDILIEDEDYAIIIENKINDAVDQHEQLFRYINVVKEREKHYSVDRIFVIYMPAGDWKDPCDDSWGAYKQEFQERYLKLNYNDHILPWLKEELLPEIRMRDTILHSGLVQYIDYLEGMFNVRKNVVNMEDIISSKLGFGNDDKSNYKVLEQNIQEIDALRMHLLTMQQKMRQKYFEEVWPSRLIVDFPKLEPYLDLGDFKERNSSIGFVNLSWPGIPFNLLIHKENGIIYFGCGTSNGEGQNEKLRRKLEESSALLVENDPSNAWWYTCKITTYENIYDEFKDYVTHICSNFGIAYK